MGSIAHMMADMDMIGSKGRCPQTLSGKGSLTIGKGVANYMDNREVTRSLGDVHKSDGSETVMLKTPRLTQAPSA
jgi:hypothetical protein